MRGTPASPRRVLLVQLRRLGDVVLTAGLLEDLRAALPDAELDFLVGRAAAPLLEHHPLIGTRIVYDPDRALLMARLVRARRYDWVIDVQSSPRTAMLARLSGARVRAGWGIGFWAWVYTHVLPRSGRPTEYVVRERQRFLELLGVPVGAPRTRLALTAKERDGAERRLRAAGAPEERPRVALVLSAANRVREWPAERFAELAAALLAEGAVPVALENPGDEGRVARLRALEPRVPAVRTHDLRTHLAALAACAVLVSADTGPAHMATALGVPRVTIYGPTNPVAWNPDIPAARWVRDPARQLMTTRQRTAAGEDDPGITGVAAAEVLALVRELLAPRRTTIPATPGVSR